MSKIPNLTKKLRDDLIPILDKAEKALEISTDLLKEECLIFENCISPDRSFIELA